VGETYSHINMKSKISWYCPFKGQKEKRFLKIERGGGGDKKKKNTYRNKETKGMETVNKSRKAETD
jgi:hypothetical protein